VEKACAAAGVPGRIPHDFRRTAARNLINAGVDPIITMKLVGWKNFAMLERYAIIDSGMLERGVAKLNAYLEGEKKRPAKVTAFGSKTRD
jgi:integrase